MRSGAVACSVAGSVAAILATASCTLLVGYGDRVRVTEIPDGAAGSAIDAGVDAGDAGDGKHDPESEFCRSVHADGGPPPTFCASFDTANAFSGWSTPAGNGTLVRDDAGARSPPSSALAMTRGNGEESSDTVQRGFADFASQPFTYAASLQLLIEAADPGGTFGIVAEPFGLTGVEFPYLLQLAVRQISPTRATLGLIEVRVPAAGIEHPLTGDVPLGEWFALQVVIDAATLTGSGNTLRAFVNGSPRFDGALEVALEAGTPRLLIGISSVAAKSVVWRVRYDDVVVSLTKR